MTTLSINIKDLLTDSIGTAVIDAPCSIDIEDLIEFNDLKDREIDIHEELAKSSMIALVWSIGDVKDRRPDLSDSQAWDVLKRCEHEHDANHGITWDTIDQTAYEMFGSGNSQRVSRCERALSTYTDDTDSDANLVDFLTDAMHWCEEHDREFDNMLRIAKDHFTVEAAE